MSWNYRIVKTKFDKGNIEEHEERFAIHEVYYADDKEMPDEYRDRPIMATKEPCHSQGGSLQDLKKDFAIFRTAFERPVIDMEYFDTEECQKINDIWSKIREEAADDEDDEEDCEGDDKKK